MLFLKLWKELHKVYWICELSPDCKDLIERIARNYCKMVNVPYNPDFMNEKSWVGTDAIYYYFEKRRTTK